MNPAIDPPTTDPERAGPNGADPDPASPPRRATGLKPMLRPGVGDDLDAVNRVVTAAVMGWPLADRVKRLVLPLYLYDRHDLDTMDLVIAEHHGRVIGVAALEPIAERDLPRETPGHGTATLLHGIYVDPAHQGHGVGRRLWQIAVDRARKRGDLGMLVRAQAQSTGFFGAMGMQALPVGDSSRDYPHRFWQPLD